MEARIELLSADSPLIDTVIGWHWHEWSNKNDDADLDVWRARLCSRTNHDRVPFTLIGHLGTEPVGCVSVTDDDVDDRFADRGPWLSGMLVIGPARNLGVGRALLRATEVRASAVGATELWLHTGEAEQFYERCDWSYLVRKEHVGDDAVMRREL
ncbi:MAG: putative N-acetyltransferase [Aeromicrobium sp.]|jgi:GNAT superfamily N-acetyltransferase|nr:putative N-acetyltransferase [Aeromicrobium sp.]